VPATNATIRIATRASELALRQARLVQTLLAEHGVASELKTYRTTGDKRFDEPLSAIGGKGLFTKELESDLAAGRVECCVHSLKDLPTESPRGLDIGALLPREDPRDVLVVNHITRATSLLDLPRGSRVGTSSLRRRAQLLALRPDLEVAELRGNVPTRIRKVDDGLVHAAILAAAGLRRLGISQHITAFLEPPDWLPAAGQGAIAVQIRADDERMREHLAPLHHAPTATQVIAERAFLAALEGGCQVPIGALATTNGTPMLHGFIADVQGKRVLRGHLPLDTNDPASTGVSLARSLRARGAQEILNGLHRETSVPSPQPE
jgi:hydroxymethylbilane synthase